MALVPRRAPNPYEVYIGLEAGATLIRNFEPTVVPGLLQTEDYARMTLRNGPRELNRDDVERRAQVRMARQRILARDDRPRLWAVIDEAVIRRVVGGPEIMRAQLRHLAEAAEQGTTTIQVVPFTARREPDDRPVRLAELPRSLTPMSCTSRPSPVTSTSNSPTT